MPDSFPIVLLLITISLVVLLVLDGGNKILPKKAVSIAVVLGAVCSGGWLMFVFRGLSLGALSALDGSFFLVYLLNFMLATLSGLILRFVAKRITTHF